MLINHLDLLIQSRERLGITGKNGAGKSTLLNILAGRIPLDNGTFTVGETVRIAYYTQENEEMNPEKRMIAYLQEAMKKLKRQKVCKLVWLNYWKDFYFLDLCMAH